MYEFIKCTHLTSERTSERDRKRQQYRIKITTLDQIHFHSVYFCGWTQSDCIAIYVFCCGIFVKDWLHFSEWVFFFFYTTLTNKITKNLIFGLVVFMVVWCGAYANVEKQISKEIYTMMICAQPAIPRGKKKPTPKSTKTKTSRAHIDRESFIALSFKRTKRKVSLCDMIIMWIDSKSQNVRNIAETVHDPTWLRVYFDSFNFFLFFLKNEICSNRYIDFVILMIEAKWYVKSLLPLITFEC